MSIFSPTPKKDKKPLSIVFTQAILEILAGKQVTRWSWPVGEYALLQDGFLRIFKGGQFHNWIVSEADMSATDWAVKE